MAPPDPSPPEPSRRRGWFNFNHLLAGGFIALGAALLVLIPSQIEKPILILGQASSELDPTLFPTVVAVSLIVLGLAYLAGASKLREANGLLALDREAWINVTGTLVVLFAYALAMEPLGFTVASALLIATLTVFFGARDLRIVLASAIGVPVLTYYIFVTLLKTFLPEAPWS